MDKKALPEQLIFARNLKRAREAAGLSQQELADRAGLDRSHVSNLERGIANPSLLKMAGLAEALNCTVIDLLSSASAGTDRTARNAVLSIVEILDGAGLLSNEPAQER